MFTREQAVAAVRAWKGTPYVLRGRVRGAGADCCTLLLQYLIEIEVMPPGAEGELPFYTPDWFLHEHADRYLRELMRFGTAVSSSICRSDAAAQPGDLALFKVARARVFNHGAVVTCWPWGVHAAADGVREVNLVSCPLTSFRTMELFDPWGGR